MAYRLRPVCLGCVVMEIVACCTVSSPKWAADIVRRMLKWIQANLLPARCTWMELCILPGSACEESDDEDESKERQERIIDETKIEMEARIEQLARRMMERNRSEP